MAVDPDERWSVCRSTVWKNTLYIQIDGTIEIIAAVVPSNRDERDNVDAETKTFPDRDARAELAAQAPALRAEVARLRAALWDIVNMGDGNYVGAYAEDILASSPLGIA